MLKWMIYIFEQSVYTHDRMMRHHKSLRNIFDFYWDGNAIILMKLSSLAAVQAVKMTMVLFPLYGVIPPFHRGRRVPGKWPESRLVTSCHGPVSCLSSTDQFRSPSDKCSMSVCSNWWVPIKQNRPMTIAQRIWKSSLDVCSDEISGQWRFTHRLRRAPTADSIYPPATDLPHSHVMLSSHRRQDKSVIRRPLIDVILT